MKLRDVIERARGGDAAILAQIEDKTQRDALAARLVRDDPAVAGHYSTATLGARRPIVAQRLRIRARA